MKGADESRMLTHVISPAIPAPTIAISTASKLAQGVPVQPHAVSDHGRCGRCTFCLCLSGVYCTDLRFLQSLDTIEPRPSGVNPACTGHRDACALAQLRPLVQVSLLLPLFAALVDHQGLAPANQLLVGRPSRQAAMTFDPLVKLLPRISDQ